MIRRPVYILNPPLWEAPGLISSVPWHILPYGHSSYPRAWPWPPLLESSNQSERTTARPGRQGLAEAAFTPCSPPLFRAG